MNDIFTLNQGTFLVDGDKHFFKWSSDIPQDQLPRPSIKINIQPFLVKDERGYILLDAGLCLWDEDTQTPDIVRLIHEKRIEVKDIHTVLISHLHQDHFSGLFHPQTGELIFSDAHIYIYKPDWEHCLSHHRYPHYEQHLRSLSDNPLVHWVEGEQGNITPNIRYLHTGAHMPFHLVFWLKNNGRTIFYGGDEAPQLMQMKMNLIAKYDFDGKKASDLRKQWFQEGEREGWTFLFYHEVQNPILNFGGVEK